MKRSRRTLLDRFGSMGSASGKPTKKRRLLSRGTEDPFSEAGGGIGPNQEYFRPRFGRRKE